MHRSKLLAAVCAAALCCASAQAAVTPNSIVTPQTPNRGIVQFLQGTDSAGTYKTLYTAGPNGSKCMGMTATTSDASVGHLVTIQLNNGAVAYGGVAVNVPANSGFASSAPPVTVMASWAGLPIDENGNPYLFLASGDTIKATFATNLTTSDVINLVVVCVDY